MKIIWFQLELVSSALLIKFYIVISAKIDTKILLVKNQKSFLFFYLHFPWLYGPWKLQRILKKLLFWKYDSWFPKSCQNSLWQNSSEMMNFKAWKKSFWLTLCCSFWSNWILETLWTSKWLSESQFCERYLWSFQKNYHKRLKNGHFWNLNFQVFFFQNWKSLLSKAFVIYVVVFYQIKI